MEIRQLADDLSETYRHKAEVEIELAHLEQDREARILFLAAPEGWPGTSEDKRRMSRDLVLSTDPIIQSIDARRLNARDNLTRIDGEIAALDVLFKGERWEIRRMTAEALRGRDVEEPDERVETDAVMDDLPF